MSPESPGDVATASGGDSAKLLEPEFMRQLDRLAVLTRRAHYGRLDGEQRSPRHGQSVEFADFRQYSPGDDIRQVDWNAYARLERFFLKLFVSEEDTTVHLLVDSSRSMRWGDPSKLEFARRLAAAIGYVALTSLEWVAVSPYTAALASHPRPLRGRSATGHLFKLLSGFSADGETDLATVMGHYSAAIRRPGPMLILSDLYDPGWRRALRTGLGARYDLTVVHILSPEEIDPELDGDLLLIDDETGEEVEITAEGDTLALYRAELRRWRAEMEEWCWRRGIIFVPVDTRLGLSELVMGILRRQGVVG